MINSELVEWIRAEDLRVKNVRPFRRARLSPLDWQNVDVRSASIDFVEDEINMLELEITDRKLDSLRRRLDRAELVMRRELDQRTNLGQRWIDGWRRHYDLLAENEQYREAWKEFQVMRSLMGEDTVWP